ncbi:phospho-N-acetylmuramoyl-pentapeptide-transferase [Schlesneria sp.]|uniref:phospho-N-acetylmuramoyl-pentapeptide- transferase n=1 Tax=Schlesneria sp. TaxID=2762018 RepID=UPI002F1E184C
MLVWLLNYYGSAVESLAGVSTGDSRVFLTIRIALATLISFTTALFFGPYAIKWLKLRFRERIVSASARLNELHSAKRDTPTMGGIFIVLSIVVAGVVCGDLSNRYLLQSLLVVIAFGAIGAHDDWIKVTGRGRGLSVRQKFFWQWVIALGIATLLYFVQFEKPRGLELVFPIGKAGLSLGALFIAWAAFVMVGSSNGVNLTDGLDGLASGCLIFAGSAFTALSYVSGHRVMAEYLSIAHMTGAGELGVVFGALVGAMLGFLWFNCHPAQVFMGDSGSLPTGALLGYGALVTRQELLLLIVGGVFVVETLSVILQVGCYKLTGKRVLACSPLHNHFVFKGEPETRIVARFWIAAALLAMVGVASLKIR